LSSRRHAGWRRLSGCLLLAAAVGPTAAATNLPGLAWGDYPPNLPVFFLEAQGPLSREQKTPGQVRCLPPQPQAGADTNLPAVVRIHGATSSGYPKKSFALTLDNPAGWMGLPPRRHWVLNAAYIDRSLMRHKLAYDLFRSLAAPQTPRHAAGSRFVEVYFNGGYHGVHLLMERVDGQLLGLRPFNSNELHHACLYKAVDHAADFGRAGNAGFEQREPEPERLAYWPPLQELTRFVSSAPREKFFDPQAGVESLLDLDNAIDFHLLVLVTGNRDGITKNYLVARDAPASDTAPRPRFFFVPWDYDGTFGRDWNASRVGVEFWLTNHLFERLRQNPEYRARFAARWRHCRDGPFSAKSIQGMMEANARTLGEAAGRNFQRWPLNRGPYPDRLTFEEDLAQMRTWIEARLQWLDREIERWAKR